MAVALAVFAHPDDMEIVASGTLLRLQRVGYEIHCLAVANGCCGSEPLAGTSSIARTMMTEPADGSFVSAPSGEVSTFARNGTPHAPRCSARSLRRASRHVSAPSVSPRARARSSLAARTYANSSSTAMWSRRWSPPTDSTPNAR